MEMLLWRKGRRPRTAVAYLLYSVLSTSHPEKPGSQNKITRDQL